MRNRDEIMREWKRRAAHYEEQRDSYSEGWKDALDWAMGEVDMAKVYLKRVPEHASVICRDVKNRPCVFQVGGRTITDNCPHDRHGNLMCYSGYCFRLATKREIAAYLKRHQEEK